MCQDQDMSLGQDKDTNDTVSGQSGDQDNEDMSRDQDQDTKDTVS